MLQLSDEALALVRQKQTPIFIDPVHSIESCCFEFSPCPAVRFGRPKKDENYRSHEIQGVEVLIPHCFPGHQPFTIGVSRFFGFTRLVLEGWRLV